MKFKSNNTPKTFQDPLSAKNNTTVKDSHPGPRDVINPYRRFRACKIEHKVRANKVELTMYMLRGLDTGKKKHIINCVVSLCVFCSI